MHESIWLRIGLASLIVGGAGAATFVAGCGDDDDGPRPIDSGIDSPVEDAEGGAQEPAKIILVHASPDLPAVRFCVGIGNNDDGSDVLVSPIPALPHLSAAGQPYPGVFPGTGGPLPSFGDLSQRAVTGFVLVAERIAGENRDAGNEKDCATLVGPQGIGGTLQPNVDYFRLPTLPKGTFPNASTTVIAATGCLPAAVSPGANANKCGPDYDPIAGNLAPRLFQLDRVITSDVDMGVQVIHVASPLSGAVGARTDTGFLAADGGPLTDAGGIGAIPVTTNQSFGTLEPKRALRQAGIAENVVNIAFFATVMPTTTPIPLPLLTIVQLTTGSPTTELDGGAYFQNGRNYTFVIVGDPLEPALVDGGFNGRGLHYLAFPNDPPVPPIN